MQAQGFDDHQWVEPLWRLDDAHGILEQFFQSEITGHGGAYGSWAQAVSPVGEYMNICCGSLSETL